MRSTPHAVHSVLGDVPMSVRRMLFGSCLLALGIAVSIPGAGRAEPEVLDNPSSPPEGRVHLQPEEIWRVGGDPEDEDLFFGVVRHAVVDASGRTYLLDEQLVQIVVLDADGGFVDSFGREGQGPGELFRPREILWLPDGRLGVLHGRPTRIATFTTEGRAGEDIPIGHDDSERGFVLEAQSAGPHLVLVRSLFEREGNVARSTRSLVSLAADGTLGVTYREVHHEAPLTGGRGGRRMFFMTAGQDFLHAWALGPDGRVFVVGAADRYAIEVFEPDGTLAAILRRPYERVARTEQELEALRARNRAMRERMRGDLDLEVDPYAPNVLDLFVRADGEIWVHTSEGRQAGRLGGFDVYDAQGHFRRQVVLDVPFDPDNDEYEVRRDRLLVYEEARDALRAMNAGSPFAIGEAGGEDEAEPAPLSIVSYRLPLGAGRADQGR